MPFDSTPQVTPALALLRAARAKIEDPRNWVNGYPTMKDNAAGLHCIMTSVGIGNDRDSIKDVVSALHEALPEPWNRIDRFNDFPGTKHADILALFDRAERRLMEGRA